MGKHKAEAAPIRRASAQSSFPLLKPLLFERDDLRVNALKCLVADSVLLLPYYRLPFARLWVMQSIWQFLAVLSPPLLHAATWSASISSKS